MWFAWVDGELVFCTDRKSQKIVNLRTPIPVHVTYLTAWVNKDGTVNFRRDVYRRDQRLMEAMYHTEYLEH